MFLGVFHIKNNVLEITNEVRDYIELNNEMIIRPLTIETIEI